MKKGCVGCIWIFAIAFIVLIIIGKINSDPDHQVQQYEREQKEKAQSDKQRKEDAFMRNGLNIYRFIAVGKWDLTIPKDPDMANDKDRIENLTLYKDTISNTFYMYEFDDAFESGKGDISKVRYKKKQGRYFFTLNRETGETMYEITPEGVLFEHEEGYDEPLKAIGTFKEKLINNNKE